MSFDLGPIKRPMIQESQSMQNNGGGGNLGYMSKDDEESSEEQKREENTHLLEKTDDVDVIDISVRDSEYESEDDTHVDFNPKAFINKIADKLFHTKKQTKSNPFE